MLDSAEVGEELSDQSGAGSPQPCPVEIVARSRTATPRVEHVSTIADDPISGNPDNVKQWWEELQLMHDADEVGGMKVARTLLDIPAINVPPLAWASREIELPASEFPCSGCGQSVSIVADGPFSGSESQHESTTYINCKETMNRMVGDGHNAHPETSVPFESREAAVSIVADGPFFRWL